MCKEKVERSDDFSLDEVDANDIRQADVDLLGPHDKVRRATVARVHDDHADEQQHGDEEEGDDRQIEVREREHVERLVLDDPEPEEQRRERRGTATAATTAACERARGSDPRRRYRR